MTLLYMYHIAHAKTRNAILWGYPVSTVDRMSMSRVNVRFIPSARSTSAQVEIVKALVPQALIFEKL